MGAWHVSLWRRWDGTSLLCSSSGCCWSPFAPRTGVNDSLEAKHSRIRARSSAGVNQCLGFDRAASICLRKGCNVGNRDKGTHVLAPYMLYNCLNKSTAQNGFARCWGGGLCFTGRFIRPHGGILWWLHLLLASATQLGYQHREGCGCIDPSTEPIQQALRSVCWAVVGPCLPISPAPVTHRSWSKASAGLWAAATIPPLFCWADE